jgi:hypothetical protein
MSNITINSIPKAIKSISKEEWLVGGAVFLVVYVLVTKYWKKPTPTNVPENTKPNRMVIDDMKDTRKTIPVDVEERFKKVAGSSYDKFISDIEAIGLDKEIAIRQLYTETTFDPKVLNCSISSSAGAKGIAQMMPITWSGYGDGGNICDVGDSLKAYPKLMRDLMKRYPNRIDLVLAGYNWRPYSDTLKNALNNKTPFSEYKASLPRETRNYIASILQP